MTDRGLITDRGPDWAYEWRETNPKPWPYFIKEPDVIPIIEKKLLDGATYGVVASIVGIPKDTIASWLARGANGDQPYVMFAKQFHRAHAEYKMGAITAINTAKDPKTGQLTWAAQAWLLERLDREDFGSKPKLIVVNQSGSAEAKDPKAMWQIMTKSLRDIEKEISTGDPDPERLVGLCESRQQIRIALGVLNEKIAKQEAYDEGKR